MSKAPILKSWTTMQIESPTWSSEGIGIRCDGLMAVDVDVDDYELRCKISQLLPPTWVRARTGTHKRLHLYSYDGRTMPYLRREKDGKSYGIDFLCGPERQFAAYGKHPTGNTYYWLDKCPGTTDRSELQPITWAELTRFKVAVAALFEAEGMKPCASQGVEVTKETDLTGGMMFQVVKPDMGLMSWDDISEYKLAHREEDMWCNLTAFRPNSDSGAGHILISDQGDPYLFDFVTSIAHFRSMDMEPPMIVKAVTPKKIDDTRGRTKKVRLEEGWLKYVLVGGQWAVPLSNPYPSSPARMRLDHFKRHLGAKQFGGWLDQAYRADFDEFRPDVPTGINQHPERKDFTFLNTYLPPVHETGGSTDAFWDYLNHMIPSDKERGMVIDWLTAKIKDPCKRLHTLMFVSDRVQGAGRDTFNKIVSALLGEEHTRTIKFSRMTGQGSQSEFNGFMSNTLLIYTPEAKSQGYRDGEERYENIKHLIDPHLDYMEVNEKGIISRKQRIFCSTTIATNHIDALVIPREDRRMILVSTPVKLPKNHPVLKWRLDPKNIGALYEELKMRDYRRRDYDDTDIAPKVTETKMAVQEATMNEIELAILDFTKQAKGCLATSRQIEGYVKQVLDDSAYSDDQHLRKMINMKLRERFTKTYTKYIKESGRPGRSQRLTILDPQAFERMGGNQASVEDMLEEIVKNDPELHLRLVTG